MAEPLPLRMPFKNLFRGHLFLELEGDKSDSFWLDSRVSDRRFYLVKIINSYGNFLPVSSERRRDFLLQLNHLGKDLLVYFQVSHYCADCQRSDTRNFLVNMHNQISSFDFIFRQSYFARD